MFEGVIAGILKQYLGQFVLGLDANQLGISVFSGKLKLENLQISPDAFKNAGIKLPITLKAGSLGMLEISGLKHLTTKPVAVVIQDVYLILGPNSAFEWTEEDELNSFLTTKRNLLETKMEEAKNAEEAEKNANSDLSWAEKFTAKIVDNLQLDTRRTKRSDHNRNFFRNSYRHSRCIKPYRFLTHQYLCLYPIHSQNNATRFDTKTVE